MLSSVFCSSTSCGWTSMLKRRAVWNRRISTCPKEMSFSGFSKIGSQTVRMAASNSLSLVSAGTQPESMCSCATRAVVALEEGKQVARQVVLILRGQAADDAAVDGDVLRILRRDRADENVAGVHVGVEKAVTEDLGEEQFNAALGQLLHVGALIGQGRRGRSTWMP